MKLFLNTLTFVFLAATFCSFTILEESGGTFLPKKNEPKNASIIGFYKTEPHEFYKKQYGTIQYETLEIKEGNEAVLSVITDNSNSTLGSSGCTFFKTTDYLNYKVVEDGKIEFTCVRKTDEECGTVSNKGYFTYVLEGSTEEDLIRIKGETFRKQ